MKTDFAYIYNKVSRAALIMLCLVLFFSCVKADLCTEENHAHVGNIKIVYHWEDADGVRPDSMLALVNRVTFPQHIGYVTDSETSVGGHYRFGKLVDDAADESLVVEAGRYQVIAFNNDVVDAGKTDVKDYDFVNLEKFGDGQHFDSVSVKDIGIAYVGRELSDDCLELYGKDWQTMNPGLKYIVTDSKPIYLAMSKKEEDVNEQIYEVKAGQETTIDLYPRKVTQDITFSFPIYTEKEQVSVDSIIAEISGIPNKMMLYSGELDIDNVYKMLFKFDVADSDVVSNDTTMSVEGVDKVFTKQECEATISVMGLVRNKDPKDYTGAGILQLCLYASTKNADGEKVSMTPQYARINLYNTLYAARLITEDRQGGFYLQNPEVASGATIRLDFLANSLVVLNDGYRTQPTEPTAVKLNDAWAILP